MKSGVTSFKVILVLPRNKKKKKIETVMGEGGWCQRCFFLLKICSSMEEGKNDMKRGILKRLGKSICGQWSFWKNTLQLSALEEDAEMEKLFFGCLQDDSWYHRSCCQSSLPDGPVQGSQWGYSFVHLFYYCFLNNCFKCSPLKHMRSCIS